MKRCKESCTYKKNQLDEYICCYFCHRKETCFAQCEQYFDKIKYDDCWLKDVKND